jgi:pyridoxal phosphate enzyme (YggS family)
MDWTSHWKEPFVAKNSPLADRLNEVRDRIAAAATRAGRSPKEVTLIAVTKTAAPEQMREIVQLGVSDLGESRVQVISQRIPQLTEFLARQRTHGEAGAVPAKVRWHMIGHLQRNKVKPLLPLVDYIHSIDSLRLAEEIEQHAGKLGRKVPVLLEVNASEEGSKTGVAVGAAVHLAEQIDSMQNVALVGLMTMAPLTDDMDKCRFVFGRTREVFEEMKWHKIGGANFRHLSMGMSNDYPVAIEEGATMIRIGTSLFGGKPQTETEDGE